MCPSGYQDLFRGSEHCFKIVTTKRTWEDAKTNCEDEQATLACFGNLEERDYIANICDGCWVGYQWKNGAYQFSVFCHIRILNYPS